MIKKVTYVVWQEGEQFVSQCLNVDIASCGNTYEEAVENLLEALSLYFEDSSFIDSPTTSFTEVSNVLFGQREVAYA